MRKEHILQLLDILGVQKPDSSDEWVRFACLLSAHTHESGRDSKPSAGISIHDDAPSFYKCFTCAPQGFNLEHLIRKLFLHTGEYPDDAAQFIAQHEQVTDIGEPDEAYEDALVTRLRTVTPEFPAEIIDLFDLIPMDTMTPQRSYLHARGISDETIVYFGIRLWQHNLVILPITNAANKICSLRARNINASADQAKEFSITPKWCERDWLVFPTVKETGAWFGLGQYRYQCPVMIVEGPMDAMRLHSLGYTGAIAACGAYVTKSQLRNIPLNVVHIGFDSDQAGREATDRLVKALSGYCAYTVVDWSQAKNCEGRGCKDPGEMESQSDLDRLLRSLTYNFPLDKHERKW